MEKKAKHTTAILLSVIFVCAFIVRLIYLLEIKSNPFFNLPISDARWHDLWALEIVKGNWLGDTVFFRAPLYPYFLSLIYLIFGHKYFIARLIQIIIGSLNCSLIFLIARHLMNKKIAIIAGLISAFYGVFVYFDTELLIPVLIIFLNLLLVYILLKNTIKQKWSLWFLSGIILGFSAIARPNILIFIPGVLIWFFVNRDKLHINTAIPLFLTGIILVIVPVTLRNYYVGHDFVPISSQGGINLYIGNNPIADGKRSIAPGLYMAAGEDYKDNVWLTSVEIAEEKTKQKLKPSEVSSFWVKQTLDFVKNQPFKYLKLQVKKLYYFWNGFEIESNKSIYLYRQFSALLKFLVWLLYIAFPFGFIGPLALTGMFLTRTKIKKLLLVYLFIIFYMCGVILFFVTGRFRLPVIPFLIIFAAYAVFWFYKQIKENMLHRLIIPVLIFFGLLIACNSNLFNVRKRDKLREHFYLGFVYGEKNLYDKAISEYNKALQSEYDPLDPLTRSNAHHNLGLMYRKKNLLQKAEEQYLAAIKINPQHIKAYCNLGTLYAIQGMTEKAEQAYKQALAIDPAYKAARLNLQMLRKLNK